MKMSIMAAMRDAVGLVLDPLRTATSRWRRQGDVVRFRVAPLHAYLLAHPDHIRHVLHSRREVYARDPAHAAALGRVSGDGLTASEGRLWRQQRELLRPLFRRRHGERFAAAAASCTERMLERWRARAARGEPLDLGEEMLRLSLETIAEALFRADLRDDSARVVADAATVLGGLYRSMRLPLPWMAGLGSRLDRRGERARSALYALAADLLATRDGDSDDGDLLAVLARHDAPALAVDQIVTMILAGHDTTGAALTWALRSVATHPEVGYRLRSEALAGPADPERIPYAAAVFAETLRLYPPAWMLSRSPSRADEVAGVTIQAGASVFVSPYVTHRHPEFWPDPERFDPDRFLAGAAEAHPYAYLPFGAGPRMCIGKALAEATGRVALARIAAAVRLTPRRECRAVALDPRLTLHAKPRLLMDVAPL